MNTTPLKDEMVARVAHLDAPVSMSQAVHGKIRATKRRRAAGAGAAVCAAAVVVGVTVVSNGRPVAPAPASPSSPSVTLDREGMPQRTVATSPDDVVRDGLRYRAQVADDTLVVASIGAIGQSQTTLSWTPTTTKISIGVDCWLPGDEAKAKNRMAWFSIDGQRVAGTACSRVRPNAGVLDGASVTPGEPGQGFAALEVGRPVTATVEVTDSDTGKRIRANGTNVRVSAAVYALGARRLVSSEGSGSIAGKTEAQVPQVTEHEGYRYRLASLTTKPAIGGPVTVTTPSNTPFLVTYGSVGLDPEVGSAGDVGRDYLDGLDEKTGGNAGGIRVNVPQRARAAGEVTLRHEGAKPKRGVQFIAVYTPTD